MDHQKVFSTHIFVKDNYLTDQRLFNYATRNKKFT